MAEAEHRVHRRADDAPEGNGVGAMTMWGKLERWCFAPTAVMLVIAFALLLAGEVLPAPWSGRIVTAAASFLALGFISLPLWLVASVLGFFYGPEAEARREMHRQRWSRHAVGTRQRH